MTKVNYAHKRKRLNAHEADIEKIKERRNAYYRLWYERTREQRNANKERLRQERLRQGLPAHRVTCVPVTWVKKPGPPVKVGQPWKALGVSKSTYYRRVRLKAHEVLTDPGSSTGNRPS